MTIQNLIFLSGLVSLEMSLSADPLLGDWKIKVDIGETNPIIQYFKVDEYGKLSFFNPFSAGTDIMLMHKYANRLDQGQLPSNSATGLRFTLMATYSIIPHQSKADFRGRI